MTFDWWDWILLAGFLGFLTTHFYFVWSPFPGSHRDRRKQLMEELTELKAEKARLENTTYSEWQKWHDRGEP